MVLRIDGKSFTKFSKDHDFKKPNDEKALELMNISGKEVMNNFKDIIIGYGQSDEFSFIFKRDSDLFDRRIDKITSNIVSCFSGAYVLNF